jgi:phosphatidylinositol-3-phosphatase
VPVAPRRIRRAWGLGGLVLLATLTLWSSPAALAQAASAWARTAQTAAPAPVKHVWLIMLENHSFAENFGRPALKFHARAGSPASMTYLARTLPAQGALLDNYYGIAHPSNANYTALLSGQPPSFGYFSRNQCPKTGLPSVHLTFCTGGLLDCLYFTRFAVKRMTSDGVAVGQGCVYPTSVPDIGTQLQRATPALTVKAYQEDMPTPCLHPKLGAYDSQDAGGDAGYETGNNPFVYFRSWIDHPKQCAANDVPLNRNSFEPLVENLRRVSTTPNLSWIGMNLCDQGHDDCPNFYAHRRSSKFFDKATICNGAQPASEYCDAQASWFLSRLIPKITASPAYRQNGLIAIMWDEANFYNSSPYVDNRACCNETHQIGASGKPGITGSVHIPLFGTINVTPGTNRLLLGGPDTPGNILGALKLLFEHPHRALAMQPGGGNTGAILLSPFIRPGTVVRTPYNHFSLLRTIQRIFHLHDTGEAADPLVNTMGSNVFNDVPAG